MTISDSSHAFNIQYKMLQFTGGWPQENSPVFYKIRGIVSYVLTFSLSVTMFAEAYSQINNFAGLSEILYILITVVVYNIKCASFFKQRKPFRRMLNLLKHPAFISYPDDLDYLMINRIKYSRLFTKIFRFFVLLCIALMSVLPLIENRPLPYPFSYDLKGYTPFMYLFQVVSCFIVAYNSVCYDSLAASFIGISITHLEILAARIRRISDEMTETSNVNQGKELNINKIIKRSLIQCLKHHSTIVEFIEHVDQVFSFCTFCQFLGSSIIICNTLFYILLTSADSPQLLMLVNYMAVVFVELLIYCWLGNEVIWKSVGVGEACYLSNWYNCNKEINKYLFILMERSKRPIKITASKISVLSLTAFTSIIQWSYSCFALLMKLYAKQH